MHHHLSVVPFLHHLLLNLLHGDRLVLGTQVLKILHLRLEMHLLLFIEFHGLAHHLLLLFVVHVGLRCHRLLLLLHLLLLLRSLGLGFKLLRLAWSFLRCRIDLLLLFLLAVHFSSSTVSNLEQMI